MVQCCPLFIFDDEVFKQPAYVMFREVVIVLVSLLFLEALHYYDLLGFFEINITGTAYMILLALCIYTFMGSLLMVLAKR